MKLKKFAALALAGVMAVSMLAGCAGKGTTTDEGKPENTDLASAVVAKLDKDTTDKVTFTTNNDLTAVLATLKQKYGSTYLADNFKATELNAIDPDYSEDYALPAAKVAGNGITANDATKAQLEDALETATATYAISSEKLSGFPVGANTETVAKALAKAIDEKVADASLTKNSGVYTVTGTDGYTGRVDYTYTCAVSVATDTNAETGIVSYYVVCSMTRTGSEAKL